MTVAQEMHIYQTMFILSEPLFLIGVALFSYFIYTAPQDCPEKYMKLKVMGGNLENRGDIHRYCNMELRNGFYKWTLKEGEGNEKET